MADCTLKTPNVRAFLKLLRYAENMPRDDDGLYYRLFGGGTFTDTTAHPNTLVTIGRYSSTAAGAYQILYKTWLRAKQDGIAPDFSPASQDAIAFAKLESHQALQNVCDGKIEAAISSLRGEWVSLPGGSQSRLPLQQALERYALYRAEIKQ